MRLSSGRPTSIATLSDRAPITRQAIRKHLEVLADAGLVRGTRQGREHVWTLEPKKLADARAYLDEIGQQWDDALARLAAFVEEPE